MEPTGQSSCKEPLKPVYSAVWSNSVVIPNRVVFVKLSQIGVFVDSINRGKVVEGDLYLRDMNLPESQGGEDGCCHSLAGC